MYRPASIIKIRISDMEDEEEIIPDDDGTFPPEEDDFNDKDLI
jgi:hypothetical protein